MAKKLQFTGKFDVDKETVKYVEQDLTEVQQMQARANLGLYHSTKEPKALSRFSFSGNTTTGINLITSSSSVGTDAIIRIYGYNGHDYEVAEYTCKLESYFIPMAGRDCWYGNGKLASQDWSNYYGPSDYPFVIYKGELFKYGTGIILDESKMPFICSSYMVIILDPSNTDVIYHTIPREYLPDETDPTVPLWAKQPQKPTYTADEVGALSAETLPEAITTALAQAKASGAFDGADGITPTIGDNGNWYLGDTDTGKPSSGKIGKSAYQYAVDGGYTGTEAEFAAKMAEEIHPGAYPVVDMTADTAELAPNTYYRWASEISALTITLGAEIAGITSEYCFEFVSGETATTLTVPDTIAWVQEPNVEAGKTYQVSIINGIGVICGA